MSAWSTMPIDCLTALRLAVEEHAGEGTSIRTTALSLCMENKLPMIVFGMQMK